MNGTRFELLTSPSFAKMRILKHFVLGNTTGSPTVPRVAVLAFPSSYLSLIITLQRHSIYFVAFRPSDFIFRKGEIRHFTMKNYVMDAFTPLRKHLFIPIWCHLLQCGMTSLPRVSVTNAPRRPHARALLQNLALFLPLERIT